MCRREDKKITFFTVGNVNAPDRFLTVTLHKREAFEFAEASLMIKKREHYESWCKLKNYDVDSDNAWSEYYNTCITDAEKDQFIVSKISYKLKDLTAIVRMFGHCLPLGCSFDTPSEYEYILSTVFEDEDFLNEIEEEAKSKTKKEE